MGIIETENIDFSNYSFDSFLLPSTPLQNFDEKEFLLLIKKNPGFWGDDIYFVKHSNPTVPLSILNDDKYI